MLTTSNQRTDYYLLYIVILDFFLILLILHISPFHRMIHFEGATEKKKKKTTGNSVSEPSLTDRRIRILR